MSQAPRRPNVLLIYPDQMRADAMSCAGNPVIRTPHMDRLANEGARFDRAFTAFPLCCPFRASLMTGKYPHANGMRANHYPIPLDQEFLPQLFDRHGYQTGYIGKWHLNGGPKCAFVEPQDRLGFRHFVGFSRGHYYDHSIFYRGDDRRPRTSKRHEPDYQTDQLIEFMSECAADPQGRPFFAMVCYGPPHSPMIAPKHWLELYFPEEVPIRENTPEPARQRARAFLAKYYGLVGNVDYNIGRLLDWLDSRDLAEDTVVIMVSDHGDMAGEHGRFGKKTYFEASMRVPFLMRYPRRWPAGRAVESFVDPSVDLPPTMLELCGIPVPRYMQGESLAPLMEGRAERGRDHAFYEICMEKEGPEKFPIPERGVRTRDWLYVRTPEGPKALYDLRQDPLETRNLAGTPSAAAPIAELEAILRENMTRTGDDWAFEAVFPPPNFQTHEDGDAQRDAFLREAIVEP